MTSLSNSDFQSAYSLAYCLHPDPTGKIPRNIVISALEWMTVLNQTQKKRPESSRQYKQKLTDQALFQTALYQASYLWERDQESENHMREPFYCPTSDDLLVRYIKHLIWKTFNRNSCHVAVGLGCHLYRYNSDKISSLAPDFFDDGNIRRIKSRIGKWIEERFSSDCRFFLAGQKQPSPDERELVRKALIAFTPWGTAHREPDESLVSKYFGVSSPESEWNRIHVLIDPLCAGLPGLINEFNNCNSVDDTMRLENPDSKLEIPAFEAIQSDQSNDRFRPDPPGSHEIDLMRELARTRLDRNLRRRQMFRIGMLRVCADGEIIRQFTSVADACEQMQIPLSASYLEVYGGQDGDEDLLLAVFPLSEPEAGQALLSRHFIVRLACGQQLELIVHSFQEGDEDTAERVIELSVRPGWVEKLTSLWAQMWPNKSAPLSLATADTQKITEKQAPALGTVPACIVRGDDIAEISVEVTQWPEINNARLVLGVRVAKHHFLPGEIMKLTLLAAPVGIPLESSLSLTAGQESLMICELPLDLQKDWQGIEKMKWNELPFRFVLSPVVSDGQEEADGY